MPKIETYNFDENISDNDFLLGTDVDEDNKTKSYKIRTLINKIKAEVELTAFIQVETLPIEDIQLNTIYILPNGDWNYYNGTIWLSNSNRPYKVYTALLTQSGTDAPVATVLENTLGDIVWSYYNVGEYKAELIGGLNINKRVIFVSPTNEADGTTAGYITFSDEDQSNDSFIVKCVDVSGTPINEIAVPRAIEIRVYN